jgi:hypothetical protein
MSAPEALNAVAQGLLKVQTVLFICRHFIARISPAAKSIGFFAERTISYT